MGENTTVMKQGCRRCRAFPFHPLRTPLLTLSSFRTPVDAWHSAIVSSVAAASDLLDQLEACGFREREFSVLGDSSFEVRWR